MKIFFITSFLLFVLCAECAKVKVDDAEEHKLRFWKLIREQKPEEVQKLKREQKQDEMLDMIKENKSFLRMIHQFKTYPPKIPLFFLVLENEAIVEYLVIKEMMDNLFTEAEQMMFFDFLAHWSQNNIRIVSILISKFPGFITKRFGRDRKTVFSLGFLFSSINTNHEQKQHLLNALKNCGDVDDEFLCVSCAAKFGECVPLPDFLAIIESGSIPLDFFSNTPERCLFWRCSKEMDSEHNWLKRRRKKWMSSLHTSLPKYNAEHFRKT